MPAVPARGDAVGALEDALAFSGTIWRSASAPAAASAGRAHHRREPGQAEQRRSIAQVSRGHVHGWVHPALGDARAAKKGMPVGARATGLRRGEATGLATISSSETVAVFEERLITGVADRQRATLPKRCTSTSRDA